MTDKLVARLSAAKGKSAVNKRNMIEFRRRHPMVKVFVFEGGEDVSTYEQWITQVKPDLTYEPFPVNGKDQVLTLKKTLDQDLNDLKRDVYYFVDRDFDDLRGAVKDESIFMTDRYAIENYFLDVEVIEKILRAELCCAKYPDLRATLLQKFVRRYEDFLQKTKEINMRIFIARRSGIDIIPHIPKKISDFISIDFEDNILKAHPLGEIIVLSREPTSAEVAIFAPLFAGLVPASHYRGKFALQFMLRWLQCLCDEYANRSSPIFTGVERKENTRLHQVSPGLLASRSKRPLGLDSFIGSLPSQ